MFNIAKRWIVSMDEWSPLLLEHVRDEAQAEYWLKYYSDRYPEEEFCIVTIH